MAVLEAHDVTKSFVEGRETVPVLEGGLPGNSSEVRWSCSRARRDRGRPRCLFILGCLLTPTSGRVVIEGEEVDPAGRIDCRNCASGRSASYSSNSTCSRR